MTHDLYLVGADTNESSKTLTLFLKLDNLLFTILTRPII